MSREAALRSFRRLGKTARAVERVKAEMRGELCDFLEDYDTRSYYGAYMLLMFEDFGGFVYIDDNKNMTEAVIPARI